MLFPGHYGLVYSHWIHICPKSIQPPCHELKMSPLWNLVTLRHVLLTMRVNTDRHGSVCKTSQNYLTLFSFSFVLSFLFWPRVLSVLHNYEHVFSFPLKGRIYIQLCAPKQWFTHTKSWRDEVFTVKYFLIWNINKENPLRSDWLHLLPQPGVYPSETRSHSTAHQLILDSYLREAAADAQLWYLYV